MRRYYAETRAAFPDQRNTLRALYPTRDGVIIEMVLEGTHLGSYRGLRRRGGRSRVR